MKENNHTVKHNMTEHRDIGVDLLRIIACLFVICIHVGKGRTDVRGGVLLQRVITGSITGDANAFFWAITGCFIFAGNRSFGRILLKFLKSIFVPALVCVLFVQATYGWIDSPSLEFSVSQLSCPEFKNIVIGVLRFDVLYFGDCVRHYWYIFEYLKALLFFPILALLIQDENRKKLYYVVSVYFTSVFINELLALTSPGYGIVRIDFFSIPCMEILWGYLVYTVLRKKVAFSRCSGRYVLAGCITIVAMIFLVVAAQYRLYAVYGFDTTMNYMGWNSSFAFIMVLGYMLLLLPLGIKLQTIEGVANKVIKKAVACTFPVYLIHGIVIHKLSVMGIADLIYAQMEDTTIIREHLYVIVMTILVFGLSAVVFLVIHLLQKCGYRLIKFAAERMRKKFGRFLS